MLINELVETHYFKFGYYEFHGDRFGCMDGLISTLV